MEARQYAGKLTLVSAYLSDDTIRVHFEASLRRLKLKTRPKSVIMANQEFCTLWEFLLPYPHELRIGLEFGTVDWLFREYKSSKAYLERVSARTRPAYELTMALVTGHLTKKGDRIGQRPIKAITPVSADKLYERIVEGPNGPRPRQGEKVIALCRRAWRVVHRLYPDLFDSAVPNPWEGVTKNRRIMATKPAASREQVYTFAWKAIEAGHPKAAAAAVVCFEWLQRPENVLAGYLRWTDYRGRGAPHAACSIQRLRR